MSQREEALSRMETQTRALADARCGFADDPPCYGCATCFARETVRLLEAAKKEARMRIYVASSWRNEERQQAVVQALREVGHEVYDFRNPSPGDHGFSWRQCAAPEQLKDPQRFRDEVLTHRIARAGFEKDMGALRAADVTVLVLPCGRSAHLELGWGARNAKSIVLLDDPMSEPELMYLACDRICVSIAEVIEACDLIGAGNPPLEAAR